VRIFICFFWVKGAATDRTLADSRRICSQLSAQPVKKAQQASTAKLNHLE
jgi:hypothetical protein